MARLSGLQLQVLALYRSFMRLAKTKPQQDRSDFVALVRSEFRERSGLPRTDRHAIEYFLRRGRRQLETLSAPNVRAVRR